MSDIFQTKRHARLPSESEYVKRPRSPPSLIISETPLLKDKVQIQKKLMINQIAVSKEARKDSSSQLALPTERVKLKTSRMHHSFKKLIKYSKPKSNPIEETIRLAPIELQVTWEQLVRTGKVAQAE